MKSFKSLLESFAHQAASKLGLQYYGFGRYGRDNHVTHVSHADHLIPVRQKYSASKGEPVLLHYEHLEDQIFNRGAEGARHAIDTLHGLVHGHDRIGTQTKIDGAPSVFFGKHEGKFFVATKGLHNKDPKINYTHEDIERNHGNAPGLVTKLKVALDHLPKIYTGNRIMQGDMMFDKESVDTRDIEGEKHYTFKPNVTRNAIPVASQHGKDIARSKMGIAIHTQYNEEGERLPADDSDVKKHPDVFLMPISAPKVASTEHKVHLAKLGQTVANTDRSVFDYVTQHSALLKQYINAKVKLGDADYDGDDFIKWVHEYHQKSIDAVKTEKAKASKAAARDELVADLKSNVQKLHNALAIHKQIADLKDKVIESFNKGQQIKRFFDKENEIVPTGPEGYVAIGHHGTHKLVKRGEFSFANFTQAKNWGPTSDHAVVTIGRMSPPHREHTNLVNAVVNHAKSIKADPYVYVTHTQDTKKNPLSADEKLEVLKAAHPDHKDVFHATSKDAPSLTHVLANLHAKGYKNVTVVLGDDRIEDFDYLRKYNGKFNDKGQGYNFDKINIVSRHSIHNTKTGADDGIHASDMRKAAMSDDYDTFKAGMNKNVPDALTRKIMQKIKERLK